MNIKITLKEDLDLFEGCTDEMEARCGGNQIRAALFLTDGIEECVWLIIFDFLRRARFETDMLSAMGRLDVDSSLHIVVRADALAENTDLDSFRFDRTSRRSNWHRKPME